MPALYGMEKLKAKLNVKKIGVAKRYRYYDMHISSELVKKDMPMEFQWLRAVLGWCGKSVDSLADRLVFKGFRDDFFDAMGIFQANNPDIIWDSAVLAALIGSCSFIYIAPDKDGFPKMRVIDGMNATGVIDPVTYMLLEGYAVLDRDNDGKPLLEAYFLPGSTQYFPKGQSAYEIKNVAPYPLLVPIIYRPDATRAFGHSRISRACMSITREAMRTLQRADIASEFYSYPQRYVLGMSDDAEAFDKWSAAVSAFLRIDKDEEGSVPSVGQFAQQSMSPFADQIRMLAGLFAGETGLTLDDLGMPSQNPSSAEAIKASHEQLRLTARKAQRSFGTGFLNAGFLGACIRDDYSYQRQQAYMTQPIWAPIFEPDASQLSGIGDAIGKIQAAFPNYFTEDKLNELTGI